MKEINSNKKSSIGDVNYVDIQKKTYMNFFRSICGEKEDKSLSMSKAFSRLCYNYAKVTEGGELESILPFKTFCNALNARYARCVAGRKKEGKAWSEWYISQIVYSATKAAAECENYYALKYLDYIQKAKFEIKTVNQPAVSTSRNNSKADSCSNGQKASYLNIIKSMCGKEGISISKVYSRLCYDYSKATDGGKLEYIIPFGDFLSSIIHRYSRNGETKKVIRQWSAYYVSQIIYKALRKAAENGNSDAAKYIMYRYGIDIQTTSFLKYL